jgi:HK97 family phage portal protein
MGLGKLMTRSTQYTVTDTVTNAVSVYTVVDSINPNFTSIGNYQQGLTIPGAWRASLLLSDLLGQVPWNAYRQPIGQPEQVIDPRPPLLEQPNPPDTRMTTFSSWALDLIWHGNAIGVVAARSPLGWPTAVYPVPATNVAVRRVTPYINSPLPVGALEYSIGEMRLGSQDVIHIKGPCPPGWVRGMGVLETQLNGLNLAQDLGRQARSISNHGVPTGVLESANPDLTEEEAIGLKSGWLAAQSSRTIAVLNASTKFTPLAWNPEQLQLVEARKFSLNELELIFGLPVGWLGGMSSSRQYSNIEQDAINLLRFSLGGHLARFEQTLSLAFPRGTVTRANLDSLLRSDTLSRYQAHALALANDFLSVDEVREIEHRPPLPRASADDFVTADRIAEVTHKVYQSVGVVLSAEEARKLLNRAGAGLSGPPPAPPPAPTPPPTVPVAVNGAKMSMIGATKGADNGSQAAN